MRTILDKDSVTREYFATYAPLVKQFCDEVSKAIKLEDYSPIPTINEKGEEVSGKNLAPAPFLPIIGNGYYTAPIRVAIYGMETLRWHDLSKFVKKFQNGSLAKVKSYTDGIEGVVNPKHIESRFLNNYALPWHERDNFWGFVYSTLAGIYGVKEKEIKERPDLLRSFIWGNVNAYERYDQTPKDIDMPKDDWQKVFKASECFNSAHLLLPYTCPQIMVVFYWKMPLDWLIKKGSETQPYESLSLDWSSFVSKHEFNNKQENNLKSHFNCYYLPQTNTFVLHTMHPSSMNRDGKRNKESGIDYRLWKKAIKFALKQIMQDSRFSSSH